MTGLHHPGNHNYEKKNGSRGSEEKELPDFVVVDAKFDGHGSIEDETGLNEDSFQEYRKEYNSSFGKVAATERPFLTRFVCLFFSLFFFLLSVVLITISIFFLLVNLITLFQMDRLWKQTRILLLISKKLFLLGTGLAIAVISPTFGFSLIMVYLMLKGSAADDDWISTMMKNQFFR